MKVKELIHLLQSLPENAQDLNIALFDFRKSIYNASTEPDSSGIYDDFEVNILNEDVSVPFVAISFVNDDYTHYGEPNLDSTIFNFKEK